MINFKALPANLKASNLFVEVQQAIGTIGAAFFLPQILSLVGQYDPAKTVTDYIPKLLSNADQAASLYGLGSMLHLEAIKAFKAIGTSGIPIYAHPLGDDGSGIAATGTITVTGSATSSGVLFIYLSGQKITVAVASGDADTAIAIAIDAAITAALNVPVTSSVATTVVTLTSKWKGETANEITIVPNLGGDAEIAQNPTGPVIGIVDMASGAVNPDTTSIFTNMGNTWFTRLVFPYRDSTNLDVLEDAGDTRFAPEIRRFFIGIVGSTKNKADFISEVSARNSLWSTFVPAHDSPSLPFEVASATLGISAVRAQADPARKYTGLELQGIIAGADIDPLTYNDKNDIENAGGSTTFIDSFGAVRILDLNTTLTLNELSAPVDKWATRTLVVSNNQAKVFSIEQLLTREPFIAAKIVSNDAVTTQEYAISPRILTSFITSLIDELWIPQAWSKNRDEIVAGIQTEIDTLNPERLNAEIPDDHAVGLRILAVLYKYAATSNF